MRRARTDCEGFHRRDFLKVGAAGILGLGLADALRAKAFSGGVSPAPGGQRPATGVIQIWLSGGPATIDMWDPKPDAPEEIRGDFGAIATAAPGVALGEHLPRTAKVMDRCVVVRSLGHTITAHGPGTVYVSTGNRPSAALEYPALGSIAAKVLPARPGIPPFVTFSALGEGAYTGTGYLGPEVGPFPIEGDPGRGSLEAKGVSLPPGVSLRDLADRDGLRSKFDGGLRALDATDALAGLDGFHRQAVEILRSDRVRSALDLGRESDALRDEYGRTPLGQGALAARRLIEAGARFVTLGFGGWDTHGNNFGTLRDRLLPPLDRAFAALVRDLESRGLLDETIVVCVGEFGRTPRVNGTAGRDHWARTMAALLAGGGLPGGTAYGATDARGMAPRSEACSPDDLAATILGRLGLRPGHELMTSGGRPMAIFREGRCLPGLIS
jgi:hypothetical protein